MGVFRSESYFNFLSSLMWPMGYPPAARLCLPSGRLRLVYGLGLPKPETC